MAWIRDKLRVLCQTDCQRIYRQVINLEISTPERGAAYQILFERFGPHACATRERQAEIEQKLDDVLRWAGTQPAAVASAYVWAAQTLRQQIDNQVKTNELHRKVHDMFLAIPRPPE